MDLKKIVKKDVFIFILFLLIFYSLFRITDTFNQGYDIVEAHALILTNQSLESKPLPVVFEKMLKEEFNASKRFRPVWVIYMLTTVKIFGVDLLKLNIYVAFICILTSFIFFKFCFNIGFNKVQSILFALLTLIGPATVMYIRTIDAEIIGMLFLSLNLYFLSKSVYSTRHQSFYKICFILSLSLTMLSKESFFVLTPSILFLYLWFFSLKNNITLFMSLKRNYVMILICFLLSIPVFYSIIYIIGINQGHSYSGIDVNLFSVNTFSDFINLFSKTNIFIVILLGIFIFFENELQENKFSSLHIKRHIGDFLIIFIFMLSVIIPQFILYYKTGLLGRYYLPLYFGFSFCLIYLLKIIFDSKTISSFTKYFYLTIIIIYLILELKTETIPAIKSFSNKCKATTKVVNSIENDPDKDLLIVLDPVLNYWDLFSFNLYLEYLKVQKDYKYDLIYVDKLGKIFSDPVYLNKRKTLSNDFIKKNKFKVLDSIKQYNNINNILIFENLNTKFIQKNKNWFDENEFDKSQYGNYTFYSKK